MCIRDSVFSKLFEGTEYEVISQPSFCKDLYVDVELSEKDLAEIYTPEEPITKHGIQPDGAITVSYTHLDVYKRQEL